jgi:hypothetical protein
LCGGRSRIRRRCSSRRIRRRRRRNSIICRVGRSSSCWIGRSGGRRRIGTTGSIINIHIVVVVESVAVVVLCTSKDTHSNRYINRQSIKETGCVCVRESVTKFDMFASRMFCC